MKKSKTVKLFAVSAAVLAAVSCGNKKADATTDAAQMPEGVTVQKLDSMTLRQAYAQFTVLRRGRLGQG